VRVLGDVRMMVLVMAILRRVENISDRFFKFETLRSNFSNLNTADRTIISCHQRAISLR
jgi:hypothetical protein